MSALSSSGEYFFPEFEGQRFRIDGGDGDQDLFGDPLILQRVAAPWFDGRVGDFIGEAWLVRVTEGRKTGLLLALTPRTLGSIDVGIALHGWKSVIVHGIDYPCYDADVYGARSLIGGMTFIQKL